MGYNSAQIDRRIDVMRVHFPEAIVEGYEDLISSMKNHEKDRHVLAAAVRAGAQVIVSDNSRDFLKDALSPYGIECLTADEFFIRQYDLDPDRFIGVLKQQAADIGLSLPQLLAKHKPSLSKRIVVAKG